MVSLYKSIVAMATDNVNTIDYLKHIYEQKVKHNEREQATLLASKQEKEDRVAQRRLEFLSLANEVVAEDMKHNKAAESTKILKGKSKKLMAEYVDAMTEISLLEAEMECLQNHSAVEQKLSAALDVHVQTESSVEEKRGALENALHIFKHKREEMAVKKAKLTRKFDDETQECMKMVAYCDTAQNKISSWVAVPTILQSSAHKANMHEAVCYLNEKIVECRDELTGYCKHKLITCKRKQRMIQDQYKEYLIQQVSERVCVCVCWVGLGWYIGRNCIFIHLRSVFVCCMCRRYVEMVGRLKMKIIIERMGVRNQGRINPQVLPCTVNTPWQRKTQRSRPLLRMELRYLLPPLIWTRLRSSATWNVFY